MLDPTAFTVALGSIIEEIGEVAVAVSGGVDSTTLAALVHRRVGPRAVMMHAVSPAVPPEATERVRALGRSEGWRLEILDAGELQDPRYRANPVDRCFYCKSNLYGRIAAATDAVILSGTNKDDLADWRPGLKAAAEHAVRHPYVEAGVDKAGVRLISRHMGLGEIAELPASPCLSSRVETGIAIDPAELQLIHQVETLITKQLGAATVRCRVRRSGLVVELDPDSLGRLGPEARETIARSIAGLDQALGQTRPISFKPYRMGSAFLRPTAS